MLIETGSPAPMRRRSLLSSTSSMDWSGTFTAARTLAPSGLPEARPAERLFVSTRIRTASALRRRMRSSSSRLALAARPVWLACRSSASFTTSASNETTATFPRNDAWMVVSPVVYLKSGTPESLRKLNPGIRSRGPTRRASGVAMPRQPRSSTASSFASGSQSTSAGTSSNTLSNGELVRASPRASPSTLRNEASSGRASTTSAASRLSHRS